MTVRTHHFRVGNGDMTLVELESGKRVLVDINIRCAADDPDDDTPDVGSQLRDLLERDDEDRLYIDAFLLTHPDADHISGLACHFHLGSPDTWSKTDDKILIREMWSSPIIFRRKCRKTHTLCPDADAWAKEARRRVALFKSVGSLESGDRIKILGEDIEGKTDNLGAILVKVDQTFSFIDGEYDSTFSALLLGPLPPADEDEEEVLSKNNSSVIIQFTFASGSEKQAARYLFGGDAEVAIWERQWAKHKNNPERLAYDVLIAPHHCSWHSLSWDSWSKKREEAKVSSDARHALGQALTGAVIVASSCPVEDNENDPPCIRAKREYVSIIKPKGGEFRCVADGNGDEPLVFEINWAGPKIKRASLIAAGVYATGVGSEALAHG
jgi:hypothetical protein